MKFVFGPIPPSRLPDAGSEGWTPLSEPRSDVFVAQSLLSAAPLVVVAYLVLRELAPHLKSDPWALVILLLGFVLMVPIHELLHALAYPKGFRSDQLVIGLWLRRGLMYVVNDVPLSRNRILVVLAVPFIVITLALVTASIILTPDSRRIVLLLLLVHAALCTGDFATFARVMIQVPAKASVCNDGWKTYWSSTYMRTAPDACDDSGDSHSGVMNRVE